MKTSNHAHNRMFISLSCLAALAFLAPACDAEEVGDVADVDERALIVDESPEALPLTVDSDEALPEADAQLVNPADRAFDEVSIEGITLAGPGCPTDSSATAVLAPDAKSFTIIFNDMLLENPPGPKVKTTNCVAVVQLHIPQGFQVNVPMIRTQGFAFLQSGLKASIATTYFFSGGGGFTANHSLSGYFNNFYQFTDIVPFGGFTSECGTSALLNINTSLVLNAVANPGGTGVLNTTTKDGKFHQVIHIPTMPC